MFTSVSMRLRMSIKDKAGEDEANMLPCTVKVESSHLANTKLFESDVGRYFCGVDLVPSPELGAIGSTCRSRE